MANDLTRNELPAKPISPALSPDLTRLLDSAQGDDFTAAMIAGREELRNETVAMLPVLQAAATQVAGEEGVRQVVGRRFALYPQPDRSDDEWAAWWADYFETLEGVSWAALEAGMAAWVADPASEFMPKPGKLLELAKTTPNREMRRLGRARKVQALCRPAFPPAAPEERREPTEAEKAEVREMVASFKRSIAERTPATRPGLPSTAGKPDERGITRQMRDLIARRQSE